MTTKDTVMKPEMSRAVDEPQRHPPSATFRPVDAGKVRTEILPGLSLTRYSRGYYTLEIKGKSHSGQKTRIQRVLYKEGIDLLLRELFKAFQDAKTYGQTHSAHIGGGK